MSFAGTIPVPCVVKAGFTTMSETLPVTGRDRGEVRAAERDLERRRRLVLHAVRRGHDPARIDQRRRRRTEPGRGRFHCSTSSAAIQGNVVVEAAEPEDDLGIDPVRRRLGLRAVTTAGTEAGLDVAGTVGSASWAPAAASDAPTIPTTTAADASARNALRCPSIPTSASYTPARRTSRWLLLPVGRPPHKGEVDPAHGQSLGKPRGR